MELTDYIRPELLSLVPMLMVVGRLLKAAAFFSNRLIPLVLGVAGVLMAICYLAGEDALDGIGGIAAATAQGILCAGAAVYGHQLVKQLREQETETEGSDE